MTQNLIDLERQDEITIENLSDKLTRATAEAAKGAIPTTQFKKNRGENHTDIVVDLIKVKQLAKEMFKINRTKENGDAYKNSEIEVCKAIRAEVAKQ